MVIAVTSTPPIPGAASAHAYGKGLSEMPIRLPLSDAAVDVLPCGPCMCMCMRRAGV